MLLRRQGLRKEMQNGTRVLNLDSQNRGETVSRWGNMLGLKSNIGQQKLSPQHKQGKKSLQRTKEVSRLEEKTERKRALSSLHHKGIGKRNRKAQSAKPTIKNDQKTLFKGLKRQYVEKTKSAKTSKLKGRPSKKKKHGRVQRQGVGD